MTDRMRYRSLKGRQGDWLVEVMWEDGSAELVPTAHKNFYDGRTRCYARDDSDMDRFPGKLESWRERLYRSHKVVLTESDWDGEIGQGATPKRTGYVGLFDIAEIEGDGARHSFKLINRYQPTAQ